MVEIEGRFVHVLVKTRRYNDGGAESRHVQPNEHERVTANYHQRQSSKCSSLQLLAEMGISRHSLLEGVHKNGEPESRRAGVLDRGGRTKRRHCFRGEKILMETRWD